MRAIAPLLLVLTVAAIAAPASAQSVPDPSMLDWYCEAPQGEGLARYVETLGYETCMESYRLYMLTLAYYCAMTGAC